MPRKLTVSIRKRSSCGRVSGFSWNVAFVWPFVWQSKQVTPRLGSCTLRSSVWLNCCCGFGVSSSRMPSICTGVTLPYSKLVVVLDREHFAVATHRPSRAGW